MYKLVFFVPQTSIDVVKQAVFNAGAGHLGNYRECCWQVLGEGQFVPQAGSQPFLGAQGRLERVKEYRVEMLCVGEKIHDVVAALKRAHPYEEPAFDISQLVEI
ncbi:MAG: NGG1p interacting factor NIF3 [Cellvibrionaceae bacterium]|nr:NGG1p interacting factor NIF3 [Cellvibrionaceae bacterium]